MQSSPMLREGARPEVVQDNMVTRISPCPRMFTARAGGKSEWMRSRELSKP